MKFNFKIQQYQTDAVNSTVNVFAGQPYIGRVRYVRDIGIVKKDSQISFNNAESFVEDAKLGFGNAEIGLKDKDLLKNIKDIQRKNNIKQSSALVEHLGRCSLDIEMETGERVIIVTGCINALVSRVSETFIKNNSCIA